MRRYYKSKKFLGVFPFASAKLGQNRLEYFLGFSKFKLILVIIIVLSASLFNFYFIKAPADFPVGAVITIEEGDTLKQIAADLKNQKVIKSPALFSGLAKVLMNGKGVMAGSYFFEKKSSVGLIVWKTIKGHYGITPTKVTFVEGATVYDVADIMQKKFPKFDKEEFLKIAREEEGFLFPDTYYFLPNVTPHSVARAMRDNFNKKILEIAEKIEESGRTLKEIVIMASLLEKEARTLKSKQMISGILWKRIEIGMPLQVDAVFPYINGKNTYQLSLKDLKIDSPYNTYKHKGLPIGPIANPSLWSLLAAVTPVDSNYLFYLSDRSGNMYYAADFEEHKRNKRLYLHLY
ncbi:MAG: endolytic transglycosylase MltG [Candidatus Pacebacteria bacterium]|nr:endolytic transglycosylase MltG [Candidatus Paceibacterota bacterium]